MGFGGSVGFPRQRLPKPVALRLRLLRFSGFVKTFARTKRAEILGFNAMLASR